MRHFLFFNFFGTISGVREFYSRSLRSRKINQFGQKKIAITSRGTIFRADRKKASVGQVMFLKDCVYRRLRKTCIYGNQGLINNLRTESIWQNFIKNNSKFKKNSTVSRKLWMIVSNGQMLTGHDLGSGSFITYFCKKKVLTVLWFTCNVWMLICVNCVLVLPLACSPVSTLEQFWTFKQIVLSIMLYPSHTAPLSVTAQILKISIWKNY